MKFHSILSQFACSYATSNSLYVFESSSSLTCVRLYNNLHRHRHRHHFWYWNRKKKIPKEKYFFDHLKWNEKQHKKGFFTFFHLFILFIFFFQFLHFLHLDKEKKIFQVIRSKRFSPSFFTICWCRYEFIWADDRAQSWLIENFN